MAKNDHNDTNDAYQSDTGLIAALRLIRTKGIGALTYHRLLVHSHGDPVEALAIAPELAHRGGRKNFTPAPESVALRELEQAYHNNVTLIAHHQPVYPDLLAHIEDAPPILHVMGQVDALSATLPIGIVGARNASAHARQFATRTARELGAKGATIISGFAAGIDTSAHQGAMQSGTVAVLGGGLGRPYPKENIPLMEQVIETGAIISECPWDEAPTAQHFPRRNRIVSGLSKAVLVVEAGLRSGSLITARLAAEQGREVLAVPGFPNDPRSAGPNSLIRDGAGLITNAEDVIQAVMAPMRLFSAKETPQDTLVPPVEEVTMDKAALLSLLSYTPIAVDDLAAQCHMSIPTMQAMMLEMELAGLIIRYPGNRIARTETEISEMSLQETG